MILQNRKILFFAFLLTASNLSDAYRILAIFPFNGKSHNIMFNPLVTELSKRGHQVDVITHYPLENPPSNYRVIVNLDGTMDKVTNNFTVDLVLSFKGIGIGVLAEQFGNAICHKFLAMEPMQNLIKNPPNDPPYDLVLAEVR